VSGGSSNIGVKHEISSRKVGRLPLSACFGVYDITSIATYTGVSLVYTLRYLGLVSLPLLVIRITTVHPIVDSEVVELMTFSR
jgi:hypothetical protein